MGDETREDIERSRAELRARFGADYGTLRRLLFEEDPIGINFGHNDDEYDPEVRTILPRLHTCVTVDDVSAVVHEEFCRWFDADIAGPRTGYQRVAERIFQELAQLFPKRAT